jgi:hypothetical protein
MSGDFERHAAQELLAKADALGVAVPDDLRATVCSNAISGGALAWCRQQAGYLSHDLEQEIPCCWATAETGRAIDCTCWEPEYDVEQQPTAVQLESPLHAERADSLCGDCAFRPGSPERSTAYERESLYSLADRGVPFWCHRGMRKPDRWCHPDGRVVAGDPNDWTPLIVGTVPYRADGQPALLCAGWAKRNDAATYRAASRTTR